MLLDDELADFGVAAGLAPKLFVEDAERRMPLDGLGSGGLSFLCCFNASETEMDKFELVSGIQ